MDSGLPNCKQRVRPGGFRLCALLAGFVPLHALAQAPASPDTGINPQVAEKLATVGVDYIVSTYSLVANHAKPWVKSPDAQEIGSYGTTLLENYHRSVKEGTYGAQLLHGTFTVAIVAGTVGASSAVVTAPTAIAVGAVATAANNAARDYLVSDVVTKASAALGSGVDKMSKAQRQTMDALLKAEKYDEAAKHFDRSTQVLSKMRKQVAGDAASENLLEEAVNESLRKNSADTLLLAGKAAVGVKDLQGRFTKHVHVLTAFTKTAEARFDAVDASMKEMQKELAGVRMDLGAITSAQQSTALQVQIMQDVMFDQQPAAVKIQMLNSGAKPGLTNTQRDELIAALSVQVKQQKLLTNAATVVSYARDLSTILGNLGVVDERLTDAVRYGTAANVALEQAFNGNYLGAIAAVSGLFGSSARPDPMQENMKRIFAAFSEINKRLDKVLELQIKTLEGIEALSRQLASMQERIDERFDRVDFELAKLNVGLQHVIWRDLNVCETAWQGQDAGGASRYDSHAARFKNFDAMWSYTASHGDKAYKCFDLLSNLFSGFRSQNFSGNPLSLSFVKTTLDQAGVPDVPSGVSGNQYGKSALQYYEAELHRPAFNVLRKGWERAQTDNAGWGGLANAYALLSTPSTNSIHLSERVQVLKSGTAESRFTACGSAKTLVGLRVRTYLCSDTSVYHEPADLSQPEQKANGRSLAFLSEPMLRDQVGVLMQYSMFVAGPREIAKSDASAGAYTIADIVSMPLRDSYGRGLLTNALMVSDASIAQQAMLYGDLTAWFVFHLLWDASTKRFRTAAADAADQSAFADAKKLLLNDRNPWLQRNVLMLILQSSERACSSHSTGQSCAARSFTYRLARDRFFRVEGVGVQAAYATLNADQQLVAESALKALFDVHPDAQFVAEDVTAIDGQSVPIPRRLQFKLDGYSLTMPTLADWTARRLVYPPSMQARIDDRSRVASRLANYSMLEGMAPEAKARLVTILSQGTRP